MTLTSRIFKSGQCRLINGNGRHRFQNCHRRSSPYHLGDTSCSISSRLKQVVVPRIEISHKPRAPQNCEPGSCRLTPVLIWLVPGTVGFGANPRRLAFRTFYILTKPLMVDFRGGQSYTRPQPNFCGAGSPDPVQNIGAYASVTCFHSYHVTLKSNVGPISR